MNCPVSPMWIATLAVVTFAVGIWLGRMWERDKRKVIREP
jgi:hypothetical protein